MDRCSYFLDQKGLFGSFPTQKEVENLEDIGVRCFVDLTTFNERRTTPYKTRYKYIKFPIGDHHVPKNWGLFSILIVTICDIINDLEEGEKIYIHCKGGHGRSGIVVACVLCQYKGISPDEALKITSYCHSLRLVMRDKWRRLGSPQNRRQKDFVRRFFRPIKYSHRSRTFVSSLSNNSPHSVTIPGRGMFPNAHLAFLSYRDPENKQYLNKLRNSEIDLSLIKKQVEEKDELQNMEEVLKLKFSQHPSLGSFLFRTGLRPLIYMSNDQYWGSGDNGQGCNVQGKILEKIRLNLFREKKDEILQC